MGRIHKYATDTVLTLDDKVLGTDKTGTTKNFKLGDIGSFVQTNYSNLDIANGSNNRIITAVDADSLNGEYLFLISHYIIHTYLLPLTN